MHQQRRRLSLSAQVMETEGQTKLVNSLANLLFRRRTDEIGQLTGEFVDGRTKLVNSLANSSTDRRNLSTHWRIRRRTDGICQLTGEFVDGRTKLASRQK
jgi:hypothetical protein